MALPLHSSRHPRRRQPQRLGGRLLLCAGAAAAAGLLAAQIASRGAEPTRPDSEGDGFAFAAGGRPGGLRPPRGRSSAASAAAAAAAAAASEAGAAELPAWEELEAQLASVPSSSSGGSRGEPVLTLYRDTNGWCPFCERVWLALREKGLEFDEVLINLYDKPQWYKDMVPTTLVPAVKFAGSGEVIWESDEILRRLDGAFPETRALFSDPDAVAEANKLTSRVMNASMGIAYRVGNLTEAEIDERRATLVGAVGELDGRLRAAGPFLLGEELTAADCMAVPMLERYAVQMPFTAAGLDLRDAARWPGLARWYEAMEARPSYAARVQGDEYSWTAVAPVMMRLFGGQNGTLAGPAEVRAQRAERAAASLLEALGGDDDGGSRPEAAAAPSPAARVEAAAKLIGNREAVVADATALEAKSQKELSRLPPEKAPAVDAALRAVAAALLADAPPAVPPPAPNASPSDVAAACRFVAARLCAPRDMGAPAATALRAALLRLAARAAREVESPVAAVMA